jgi:hypothetical protein
MGENEPPADLQEAVDRSFREQWGGKRFYLTTAVVLFVLAVLGGIVVAFARRWIDPAVTACKVVEISAVVISFVCLNLGVLLALEALIRSQRERGQVPDRSIHAALCLSVVTVASMVFLFLLLTASLQFSGMGTRLAGYIQLIVFLFAGLAWLGSVVMSSAAAAMLLSHRSELLEVNNTTEGTSLLFRRGHSTEMVKLVTAALISLVIFVVFILMTGAKLF